MSSRSGPRRTPRRALVVVVAILATTVLAVPSAMAEHSGPNGNASCQGILSEANRPGVRDDHTGVSRQEVAHFFNELAKELGIPPGAIMSAISKSHGGSVDECLANL